jgi:hypothetical protein
MFTISLPSSRPKSNVCLYNVHCMHANMSPSCAIQEDLVPLAHVGVYRARRCCVLFSLVLKQTFRELYSAILSLSATSQSVS